MRLLAGAEIGVLAESTALAADREWSGVEAGPWLAETLAALRASDSGDATSVGALRTELRPYQREGVRWLAFLSRLRLGACLADDMGLGKTIQVLALLLVLKERPTIGGSHLLVVPASLIANWNAEAARFAPSLRLFVAHPSALDSKELAALEPEALADVDLVVTSYGTVHRLPWMAERRWGLVVLDEAQAIKNPSIKQTRAVKALHSQSRIALTGTPVENHLSDLWSIFDFLNPGLLGSAKEFGQFVKRSESYGPLRSLTRPYILRRLKTDRSVIVDLPEKTEVRAFCPLSKKQAALYQEAVESLANEIAKVDGIRRRGLVLAYLVRLKQVCNHPSQWLGDGGYAPEESGKVARLREISEVIASRQEKALVFTQFRELTKPLASWLAELFGRPGIVLSGETPVRQRQELVRRFQDDEQVPFFVLSLRAGGTGLNLTAASHVIHFDRWWNPAVENQATDRAFRIGQKKNVLVHKFVCRGTIEDRIDSMIESKQNMARDLLEGNDELSLTELGDKELIDLVSLDIQSARDEG
jgi:non-specific serine/threonine protein kinase